MDRIRELKEQAELYTDTSGRWVNADAVDRLAELIVRECIETLRLVPYNSDREFGDEAIYQEAITEHFGVEE
jgi:hypothetical protein